MHGQAVEVSGPATQEPHVGQRVIIRFPDAGLVNILPEELSREPAPPLLGGFAPGEQVYFTGSSGTLDNGQRIVHGQAIEVSGPATQEPYVGQHVLVRCPDAALLHILPSQLSREPAPPLPGGFILGETVYFIGSIKPFFGVEGEVIGPGTHSSVVGKGVDVALKNNGPLGCLCEQLAREPPLPGGFKAGETVYYAGKGGGYKNGDMNSYGATGEVKGPSTTSDLDCLFEGHKLVLIYRAHQLSRDPPPLFAGGFKPGDRLYYSGCALLGLCASGNVPLSFGERGEVVGQGDAATEVSMSFAGPGQTNRQFSLLPADLSWEEPSGGEPCSSRSRLRGVLAARKERQERAGASGAEAKPTARQQAEAEAAAQRLLAAEEAAKAPRETGPLSRKAAKKKEFRARMKGGRPAKGEAEPAVAPAAPLPAEESDSSASVTEEEGGEEELATAQASRTAADERTRHALTERLEREARESAANLAREVAAREAEQLEAARRWAMLQAEAEAEAQVAEAAVAFGARAARRSEGRRRDEERPAAEAAAALEEAAAVAAVARAEERAALEEVVRRESEEAAAKQAAEAAHAAAMDAAAAAVTVAARVQEARAAAAAAAGARESADALHAVARCVAQAAPTVGGGESDGDATKALPERATSARPEPLPARLRRVCEVLGLEPGRNLVATARSAAEALGLGLSGKSLPDQVLELERCLSLRMR